MEPDLGTSSIGVDVKSAKTKTPRTSRSTGKRDAALVTTNSVFASLAKNRPLVFRALVTCSELLNTKGHDYTTNDASDYENFEEQMRLGEQTARQVFRGIIAQKLTREKAVAQKGVAMHESRMDTITDIANYAILWLGWELKNE